jgi:hypothetical protein
MRRRWAIAALAAAIGGCGGDGDDVAEIKKALPMDQVPAAVLKAAREAEPGLTFYAAYAGKYQGKDSIELKGRSKSGKITELEITPDGKVLGTE